jgi:hypothetical protein
MEVVRGLYTGFGAFWSKRPGCLWPPCVPRRFSIVRAIASRSSPVNDALTLTAQAAIRATGRHRLGDGGSVCGPGGDGAAAGGGAGSIEGGGRRSRSCYRGAAAAGTNIRAGQVRCFVRPAARVLLHGSWLTSLFGFALGCQERVLQELRAAASASASAAASVRSGGTTPRSPRTAGSSPRASALGTATTPVPALGCGAAPVLSSPSPGGPSPSFAPSPASSRALSQTPTPLQMGSPASALAGVVAWGAGGSSAGGDTAAAARAAASLRAAGARSLKTMRYPAAVADSFDDGEPGSGRRGRSSNSGAGIRFHTNPLPLLDKSVRVA